MKQLIAKKTFSQNRPSLWQQNEIYIFLTKMKFEFAAIDDIIRRHKMESFEFTVHLTSQACPDLTHCYLSELSKKTSY